MNALTREQEFENWWGMQRSDLSDEFKPWAKNAWFAACDKALRSEPAQPVAWPDDWQDGDCPMCGHENGGHYGDCSTAISSASPPPQPAPEVGELVKALQDEADWQDEHFHRAGTSGMLRQAASALSARRVSEEVWEVFNRTTSLIFATESDADTYIGKHGSSVGLNKISRRVLRLAGGEHG